MAPRAKQFVMRSTPELKESAQALQKCYNYMRPCPLHGGEAFVGVTTSWHNCRSSSCKGMRNEEQRGAETSPMPATRLHVREMRTTAATQSAPPSCGSALLILEE